MPTIPGAGKRTAQSLLPVAPEPFVPPAEGGGPVTENSASSFTDRVSTSSAGGRGRGSVHDGLREVSSGPPSGAGSGGGQPELKRTKVDCTDHRALDPRTLLNGIRMNRDQTSLPREVSQKVYTHAALSTNHKWFEKCIGRTRLRSSV